MPRATALNRIALRDHGNNSLKFTGTSYVDFGTTNFNFERTQAFSVTMMLYLDPSSGQPNEVIFGRAAGSTSFQGWWIRYEDSTNTLNFFLANDFNTNNHLWGRCTATPASGGQLRRWIRFTVTYDGSSDISGIKFYIGHTLATTTSVRNTLTASIVAAGINARMGTITDSTLRYAGNMTDTAVFTRVLTAQEIKDINISGIYPADNLYARYKFTDNVGSTLTDSSGNARNGTITTATWDAKTAPYPLNRRIINPSYSKSWAFDGFASIGVTASNVVFSTKKNVIDFWYYNTATGGASEVITNNPTATLSPNFTFRVLRGNTSRDLALQWADAGGLQVWTTGKLELNRWYHIVLAMDTTSGAKVCKICVNSMLDGVQTTNTATGGTALNNDKITVGKASGGTGAGLWIGNLKDIRVFSFTGTFADTDAQLLYQGLTPSNYTLINRWQGDDPNNTTAVDSVAANNMTLTSVKSSQTVPSRVRQIINPSYTKDWQFNGSNAYFKTNATFDLSAVNKIVVDFWYQASTNIGAQTIVELSSNYGAAADRFLISQIGGAGLGGLTARMVTTGGEANWNATISPQPFRWLHIMAVFDRSLAMATASRMFINGGLVGANVLATGTLSGNFANQTLNIGSTNGTTSFTQGNIKDVRIHSFTGTFSSDDALAFYQGLTPAGYTPIARWIGEDSSTTATDSVGSNTGTLTNVTYGTGVPSKARTAVT